MQLSLQALSEESLQIEPRLDDEALTVQLTGACDGFAVAPLGKYLQEVHAELEKLGTTDVTFDIRRLYLLNSSCLKQFITFLHKLRSSQVKYSVKFVVDPALAWQGRGLAAFVRMCPGIVSVVKGESPNAAPCAETA